MLGTRLVNDPRSGDDSANGRTKTYDGRLYDVVGLTVAAIKPRQNVAETVSRRRRRRQCVERKLVIADFTQLLLLKYILGGSYTVHKKFGYR